MNDATTTYPSFREFLSALAIKTGEQLSGGKLGTWRTMGCTVPYAPGPYTSAHVDAIAEWRSHHNKPGRPPEHGRNGNGADGTDNKLKLQIAKLNEEVRRLENYNAAAEGKRVDADTIRQRITSATNDMRDHLLSALPSSAYDLSQGLERLVAIERIRQLIVDALNAWHDKMVKP